MAPKARCAVDFKRPTRTFEDSVAGVPLEGGLIAGGRIVGATGVSGMRSTRDGAVAAAGAAALHSAQMSGAPRLPAERLSHPPHGAAEHRPGATVPSPCFL